MCQDNLQRKLVPAMGIGVGWGKPPLLRSSLPGSQKLHMQGTLFREYLYSQKLTYSWWLKSGDHQLRLVVYPNIYRVLYIPGGAGFQPSTVCTVKTSNPSVDSNDVLHIFVWLWRHKVLRLSAELLDMKICFRGGISLGMLLLLVYI